VLRIVRLKPAQPVIPAGILLASPSQLVIGSRSNKTANNASETQFNGLTQDLVEVIHYSTLNIQTPFTPIVHPKIILAAAVFFARCGSFPRPPECARPRAQQRGKAGRHRFGQSASLFVHCCGRGRPHSDVGGEGESFAVPPRLCALA